MPEHENPILRKEHRDRFDRVEVEDHAAEYAADAAMGDHEGRAGDAGEPIAEDDDLFGSSVILAARTAAKAKGGQILVTDVVRQLVVGKGFRFSDFGEVDMKGFEEPVRLFEVAG